MVGVLRRAEWCRRGRSSLLFPRFWSCRYLGDSWIGDGTLSSPCATGMPHLYRLGRRCRARTNQRLANWIGIFSRCRVVSTRQSSVCFPGWWKVEECGTTFGPGMGPNILPRWSWLNNGQSENRPVWLGFPHRAGRYQPGWYSCLSPGCRSWKCVDGFRSRHVTLSCPGDAFFLCESWPMSDQAKLTCLYFRLLVYINTRVWNSSLPKS